MLISGKWQIRQVFRLFCFTDYEGLRSVSHALTTATLPTAAELSGLFTVDGTAGGKPIPIKNPYTGVVYANGQVPMNDPNINPVALAAFKLLPTPNIPGAGLTAANFQYLPAAPTVDDKGDGRADFVRNERQNGFFRYSQRAVTYFQPPPFPGAAGGNSNGTLYARTRQIVAGYNWTLTANSILELRFGQTWTQSGKQPIFLGAPNLLAGIPNVPQDPAYTGGLMRRLCRDSLNSANRAPIRSSTIRPRRIRASTTRGSRASTA